MLLDKPFVHLKKMFGDVKASNCSITLYMLKTLWSVSFHVSLNCPNLSILLLFPLTTQLISVQNDYFEDLILKQVGFFVFVFSFLYYETDAPPTALQRPEHFVDER